MADIHEKLLERYELQARIAVGGMAEVYRAKAFGAHGFEKDLAIKRILPELARDPEFEQRFIGEAKLAVKLSHANVVQVLDFGKFGETLFIAPVYARMIALDTVYVERTTAAGTSGRLVALEISGDGERVVQIAYVFTTQGQWRNLREQPELFSALLPNDVRPAGTCDIKLADDMNSISYSCGGSPPVSYQRVHHPLPD